MVRADLLLLVLHASRTCLVTTGTPFIIASAFHCGLGDNQKSLTAAMELFEADSSTLTSQTIVSECTRELLRGDLDGKTRSRVYCRRGDALAARKELKEALADYENALLLDKTNTHAKCRILRLRCRLGVADVFPDLECLLTDSPRDGEIRITAVICTLMKGRYADAISHATVALENNSRDGRALILRAVALSKLGRWEDALRDLDRGLALLPNGMYNTPEQEYVLKGMALAALQRWEEAVPCFDLARRLNPSSVDALQGMWLVYWSTGRLDASLVIAERMGQLVPEHPNTIGALVRSYTALGRPESAVRVSAVLASSRGRDFSPALQVYRGEALVALGRYGEALACFDVALAADRDHMLALAMKCRLRAGCPDEKYRNGAEAKALAERLFSKVTAADHLLVFCRAAAHAECGEYTEAVRQAQRAIELCDNDQQRSEYEEWLTRFREGRPFRLEQPSRERPR